MEKIRNIYQPGEIIKIFAIFATILMVASFFSYARATVLYSQTNSSSSTVLNGVTGGWQDVATEMFTATATTTGGFYVGFKLTSQSGANTSFICVYDPTTGKNVLFASKGTSYYNALCNTTSTTQVFDSSHTDVTNSFGAYATGTYVFASSTGVLKNSYLYVFSMQTGGSDTILGYYENGLLETGNTKTPYFCVADNFDDALNCGVLGLTNVNQFKSDATTTIALAATTTESYVVFGATLYNPSTSTVQLQVEVQPAGTNFTGIPNASSSFVTPGTYATTTFGTSSLVYPRDPESWSNGAFHWQARAKDSTGATSTWQLFGATTSSVDFVINTVPLYTQGAGPWPSYSSSSSWNTETYADGSFYCGGGNTIGYCGCTITSVVMWMRYWGIATDGQGDDVNPKNLNIWLTNNSGYDPNGNLKWQKVTDYASSTSGVIVFDTLSPAYGSSTLRDYIDDNLSSSTPNPVILKEANVPVGTSTIEHFILAIGTSTNNGTSTYVVRDPVWYNTKYLNQATSTDVNSYNNTIDGVRIYFDPPQQLSWGEYHTNLPNSLILVDAQGRRTGKDPITGTLYREIPNTAYDEEMGSAELFTAELPYGRYALYILGGQTGTYWLDASHYGQKDQLFRGNIESGSMIGYMQDYNPSDLKNSLFSYGETFPSTVSITAESPHNLPPPPRPARTVKNIEPVLIPPSNSVVWPTTPTSTVPSVLSSSTPLLIPSVIIGTSTTESR